MLFRLSQNIFAALFRFFIEYQEESAVMLDNLVRKKTFSAVRLYVLICCY
jgi:hypothetical protein